MKRRDPIGAASHASLHWRDIDWRSVNRNVRRLQVRIVKAEWGKVKALQRLLTHSRDGKLLAVRRVTENQGSKTSGVDGVTRDTPEKKVLAFGISCASRDDSFADMEMRKQGEMLAARFAHKQRSLRRRGVASLGNRIDS